MPLETGTVIADLNENWPLSSDPKSQGDDHLRLIKSVLKLDAVSLADTGSAEIVGADVSAGWHVWGDALVQWGYNATDATGNVAVSFSTAFKDANYKFVGTALFLQDGFSDRTIQWQNQANTGVSVVGRIDGNFGVVGFNWIAIGEAPDNLKKPKTVQTIGGAELQEFNDPAGVASWRIIGNVLEIWGAQTTDALTHVTTVNYVKGFVSTPRVTATTRDSVEVASVQAVAASELSVTLQVNNLGDGGGAGAMEVQYHAIGEWNGV